VTVRRLDDALGAASISSVIRSISAGTEYLARYTAEPHADEATGEAVGDILRSVYGPARGSRFGARRRYRPSSRGSSAWPGPRSTGIPRSCSRDSDGADPDRALIHTRADFPLLGHEIDGHPIVYLDSASTSPSRSALSTPSPGCTATSRPNVHRGVHALADEATAAYESAP